MKLVLSENDLRRAICQYLDQTTEYRIEPASIILLCDCDQYGARPCDFSAEVEI